MVIDSPNQISLVAGLVEAEVLIREPDDELIRRQKSIISTVQREDIGPIEMAEALRGLMEEDPRIKSQNDLATLIGKDKAWVSGMLRILDLPEKLRKEIGSTQLPVSYDTMIRIARTDDAFQQKELVQSLVHGATQKEVRQRIDELKGKWSTSPAQAEAGVPHRVQMHGRGPGDDDTADVRSGNRCVEGITRTSRRGSMMILERLKLAMIPPKGRETDIVRTYALSDFATLCPLIYIGISDAPYVSRVPANVSETT